ncbi:MAG TPA: hypothetical protein VMM13_10310, partial [Euzebya sp.]|nr:hypothetical protein [Euzebya sp.]
MSNHPDDRSMAGRQATQPIAMGTAQGEAPVAGPHDDPAGWGNDPRGVGDPDVGSQADQPYVDVRDTAHRDQDDPADRDHRPSRGDQGSAMDDAVHTLAEPDNRAKLLMAIAFMVALTLLITLGLLIDRLADSGGAEP